MSILSGVQISSEVQKITECEAYISIQEQSFGLIHVLPLSLMHLTSSVEETGEFKDICLKGISHSFIPSSDPRSERSRAELHNPSDLCKLNVNSIMRDSDSGPG